MNDINSLVLIYQNENGDLFEQRAIDLVSSGTFSDADTGEDLELIGWKEKPGPRLQKLIENGDAYMNQPNPIYVYGIASDGVVMVLGETSNYAEIERFLKKYPTPEDW